MATAVRAAELTVEASDAGAVVRVDGEVFAEYLKESGRQPAIWPVIGPSGKPVTRAYPIGPRGPHEEADHLHHRSIWFSHGLVNGLDFWTTREESLSAGAPQNRIVHQEFTITQVQNGIATIGTRNQWISKDDKTICNDERLVRFGVEDDARWIDFTITLMASHGDVTLGDTKEGAFGVRVAGTMKLDAKQGGRIVSSTGRRDKDAWGQAAEWVDYVGPVEGETLGIAIFSHPDNFRLPCRWHVRSYGLFAANPFGRHHFPPGEPEQGEHTIRDGESLTLHYRVVIHRGDTIEGKIPERYAAFVRE